jgi:hypothetical protein
LTLAQALPEPTFGFSCVVTQMAGVVMHRARRSSLRGIIMTIATTWNCKVQLPVG